MELYNPTEKSETEEVKDVQVILVQSLRVDMERLFYGRRSCEFLRVNLERDRRG